jgi:hypothetical protein
LTTFNPSSPDLAALQQQLLGRFERFRRRVRAHLLLEGVARVLAEVVGLALLSFILDRVFRLGLGSRVVYVVLALGFVAWEAFHHVIHPLQLPLNPVDLATAIDRHRNGSAKGSPFAARVAAVLQLPELLQQDRPPSEPLVRRAVQRSYESLQAEDFNDALDERRRNVAAGSIAALVFLPILLAIVFPFSTKLWAKRWVLGSSDTWPQKTYLTVADLRDGKILVPRGEPHVLRVGTRPSSVEPENVSLTLRVAGGRKTTASMNRFGPGDFRFDLPPLTNDATVELSGGDDEFGPFRVEPVDRPRVDDLVLSSQHPTQSKSEIHHFSGVDAEMSFLPKTRLELTLVSIVPVAEVKLKSQTPRPGLNELRRLSDRSFALAWTQESPVQLTFELVGTVGDLASVPTPLSIALKVDQTPRVSLQYTGVRQRITPQAHVPLNIQSRDDYGLAKIELATRAELPISLSDSKTKPTTAPAPRDKSVSLLAPATQPTTLQLEIQHKHEFDVSKENLSPGSLISFTARATDACYTGAQTGSSRTVTFRVVAPEELFRDIILRQQAERAKFRKTISDSEKLRADLISLSGSDAASALARQHRVTQREVTRIATALGESVVEMRLNALGGPEAWALMESGILKPLKELNDGRMSEQREALDALAKTVDAQKLAEAGNRQDAIVSKMNEILKQMSQWDSFVDVINQLNEIIKLQDNVRNNTEKLKENQTQGVFDK